MWVWLLHADGQVISHHAPQETESGVGGQIVGVGWGGTKLVSFITNFKATWFGYGYATCSQEPLSATAIDAQFMRHSFKVMKGELRKF